MMRRTAALLLAAASAGAVAQTAGQPRALKVLIISMFEPEAASWIEPFGLTEQVPVPGLRAESPALRCNADGVCLLVAGMGHANVAASTLAVTLDPTLDLRRTYFLIAGIAGIDPTRERRAPRHGHATWSTSASRTSSMRARCPEAGRPATTAS